MDLTEAGLRVRNTLNRHFSEAGLCEHGTLTSILVSQKSKNFSDSLTTTSWATDVPYVQFVFLPELGET
jgi:hypothetical protein